MCHCVSHSNTRSKTCIQNGYYSNEDLTPIALRCEQSTLQHITLKYSPFYCFTLQKHSNVETFKSIVVKRSIKFIDKTTPEVFICIVQTMSFNNQLYIPTHMV